MGSDSPTRSNGAVDVDATRRPLLAQGYELIRRRSFEEAARVLEEVIASGRAEDEPIALLHLAEVYQNLQQPERAVGLLDLLLQVDLSADATSFILNRRGIYLKSAGDSVGARQSYELALIERHDNRHACYNLAALFHLSIFPATSDFSMLLHAIDLYRAALGRPREGAVVPSIQAPTSVPAANLGGPVNRLDVSQDLAVALLQAGRADEAIEELENVFFYKWGEGSGKETARGEPIVAPVDRAAADTPEPAAPMEKAIMWGRLANAKIEARDLPGAVVAGEKGDEELSRVGVCR